MKLVYKLGNSEEKSVQLCGHAHAPFIAGMKEVACALNMNLDWKVINIKITETEEVVDFGHVKWPVALI